MTFRIELIVSLLLSLAVGAGAGLLWWSPRHQPPEITTELQAATGAEPTATAPAGADPVGATVESERNPAENTAGNTGGNTGGNTAEAAPTSATAPNSAATAASPESPGPDAGALLPAATLPVEDTDASLIARGRGKFALLLLEKAGVKVLLVRQGALERDGDGRFAAFARAPIVARLRGAEVRVELLHLGFDRDGRATVAHIRIPDTKRPPAPHAPTPTADTPPAVGLAPAASAGRAASPAPAPDADPSADPSAGWIEGVVSLQLGDTFVGLRAEAPLAPPAIDPSAEPNADPSDDVER